MPEKFSDIVAKVNVYATPAYSFYDMDEIYPERVKEEAIAKDHIVVLEKKLKPENVEKLLFYRVGSIDAIEDSSEMLTVKTKYSQQMKPCLSMQVVGSIQAAIYSYTTTAYTYTTSANNWWKAICWATCGRYEKVSTNRENAGI